MTRHASEPLDLYCTGARLRRATRRATQIYDHALAPFSLTVTQYSLIAMLARDGAMPLGALADVAGMDRTSMTRTIRPLQKAGFVAIAAHDDDRRFRIARLTSAGEAAFTRALKSWQRAQRHVNRSLGAEGLDALHGLLSAVSQLPALDGAASG